MFVNTTVLMTLTNNIADLLDVARIETGTLPVDTEPSEVTALVDYTRSRFQSGGSRNNLHMDLPPGPPPLMADRRRIVQVLSNLLSNAARHSHQSSAIRWRRSGRASTWRYPSPTTAWG